MLNRNWVLNDKMIILRCVTISILFMTIIFILLKTLLIFVKRKSKMLFSLNKTMWNLKGCYTAMCIMIYFYTFCWLCEMETWLFMIIMMTSEISFSTNTYSNHIKFNILCTVCAPNDKSVVHRFHYGNVWKKVEEYILKLH